mmetsp:Transcript_9068/g.12563  ORF Transcript_9068/g.12563 Transcript_9068/m.12563 type:complete len:324 (-) Transcript_9068:227-1198(-)|eukprot:CAMPEP_0185739718 /NCGR_PEP_ID=MMETSP1171-20130828/36068_1 /TAXON_ID=374046 /ORGANISM="Helicotheca tamensis, Strain CCMP826" /LENGTH=323 /DNA_ID=CAMNT_0028411355 /DNA_START=95 /DNA_END=1066 /DNA_ORIENTATION=-
MSNAGPSTNEIFTSGNTAVITGASSGIGRATAIMCASKGMNVWLVDVDEEELKSALEMVDEEKEKVGGGDEQKIKSVVADVSDLAAMEKLSEDVFTTHNACHFLMNNAGICPGKGALDPMETFRKTVDVNTYGPIHGCVAFIPNMKKASQTCALVVNTGSKQGITMPPGNLSYNVSKAALKTYTEGLEHELSNERRDETNEVKIRAALLIPGWTNTSIVLKDVREKAQGSGETFDVSKVFFHEEKPASGAWMPQQVVDFMMEELDKGRFYIVCPDNDVDRKTDNLRMTWTMQDITMDRPPLSRWHPDYKEKFTEFLDAGKSKK